MTFCTLKDHNFQTILYMKKRELIEREIFFGNPEIAAGKLSPDGKFISFMKAYEGIMNLYVKAVDEPFENARVLTKSKSPIMGYFWTKDSKYLLYVNDNNGDENLNVFSVSPNNQDDVSNPVSHNLTPLKEVNVQIHQVSRKDPDLLWIGINDRDKAWHDLYTLRISSQKLTMVYENNERITGWDFDWDENIRLAYRTDENGFSEILSVKNMKEFTLIYTTNLQESAHVIGWNRDNSKAYLVTNKGEDINLSTLFEMDPNTMEMTFLESDPEGKVDFGNLFLHRHSRDIICVTYVSDKAKRYWRDDNWQSMYEGLQSKFEGKEVSIVNTTDDYQKMLISVGGDRYAVEVWSYDWQLEELVHQYTTRPNLKAVEERLSPMQAVAYESSDGLTILF